MKNMSLSDFGVLDGRTAGFTRRTGRGDESSEHASLYTHASFSDDNSVSPSHRYATSGPSFATL